MSKGNSELLSKHQSKLTYTSVGVIGNVRGYEVLKEVVLRIRNNGASENNSFRVCGRMATDTVWEEIGSVQGKGSEIFHIASWDYVMFECVDFISTAGSIDLITSAFFQDGIFAVNAINFMKDTLQDTLKDINSNICDIKQELNIINRQIELITDHEEDEVK